MLQKIFHQTKKFLLPDVGKLKCDNLTINVHVRVCVCVMNVERVCVSYKCVQG